MIDDHNRAKLKKALKTVGLLEPLVWNESTGNLVGGHQRLWCIDALERGEDYELDVAAVNLSEKQEKEQNIALNNPSLQGDWDMEHLATLLKDSDLDLQMTGWDPGDIQLMFDDDDLASVFKPDAADRELIEEAEKLASDAKEQRSSESTPPRQEWRDNHPKEFAARENTEVYAVVLFATVERRQQFMLHVGMDDDDRYVDGERLLSKLGQ